MGILIMSPSTAGFNPISSFCIDFSISLIELLSKGCTTIKIHIEPENNRIRVWNNGRGIEVTEHREHDMWVPELISVHF